MPGHFGGSHSHGDKKSNNRTSSNNNRESYRTSTSYQKELDCQLHKIAAAEEKLQVLKDYEIPKGEK